MEAVCQTTEKPFSQAMARVGQIFSTPSARSTAAQCVGNTMRRQHMRMWTHKACSKCKLHHWFIFNQGVSSSLKEA